MPATDQVDPSLASRRRRAARARVRRRRIAAAGALVGLIAAATVAAFLLLSTGERASSAPSVRPPAFEPARVYAWPATAGAAFYDVRLLRNGRTYDELRTVEPRLEFPAGVQLAPGRYLLRVRPGFVGEQGITLGKALPDRRFAVGG